MPGSAKAEIYFISVSMVFILVVCVTAVYLFIRTYRKEMREREVERQQKAAAKAALAAEKNDE